MTSSRFDFSGLRVAHLIESDGPGGAERVVANLAAALQTGGAESVVVIPTDGEGWLDDQLNGSGVAIDHVRLSGSSFECVAALAEVLRQRRVHMAHSHDFSMAVYGAWAARLVRIPHIITMHGGRYYAGRVRRRAALRSAVAISRHTVAVSTSVASNLRRDLAVPSSRIQTIPNGVRYVRPCHTTLRDELGLDANAQLIVAVGNLYAVKGHQYLVDALELLAGSHPTLHVAIAGRGELQPALEARACACGLSHRLHLLGLRSDVPAVIAAADMFVLPSLSEGLPLALLEAMFAGRPIVATDVGDVRAALAHGRAGVLVPSGNALALADAIDRLLRNPDHARALADSAACRAVAEYDLSRMVDRYAELYRDVTPAPRPIAPTVDAIQGRVLPGASRVWWE